LTQFKCETKNSSEGSSEGESGCEIEGDAKEGHGTVRIAYSVILVTMSFATHVYWFTRCCTCGLHVLPFHQEPDQKKHQKKDKQEPKDTCVQP
jgi:hypothetical protein